MPAPSNSTPLSVSGDSHMSKPPPTMSAGPMKRRQYFMLLLHTNRGWPA